MEKQRIINNFLKFNDKKTTLKEKVVLMNFFYTDVNKYSENLDKKKFPHFLIYKNGDILKLKNTFSIAHCMGINDEKNIYVALENEGIIKNNVSSYLQYIENSPFHKKWKGHSFFYEYTDLQYDSLNYLLPIILDEHEIEKKCVTSNIEKVNDKYHGICGRSNIIDSYYDMTPSFLWNKILL